MCFLKAFPGHPVFRTVLINENLISPQFVRKKKRLIRQPVGCFREIKRTLHRTLFYGMGYLCPNIPPTTYNFEGNYLQDNVECTRTEGHMWKIDVSENPPFLDNPRCHKYQRNALAWPLAVNRDSEAAPF